MGRRAALLIALIGIAAAVWWARATFVASAVVQVREGRIGGAVGPVIGDEQVWVRCDLNGSSRYSLEDGSQWFTPLTTDVPERPSPVPICEDARRDRLPTAAAIAVLGLGLATLVLASDQASRHRAVDRRVEAMAAERAAAASPPPEPPVPSDAAGGPDR